MKSGPALLATVLSCATPLVACDALSEFRTKPGEVFHGQVVGSDDEDRRSFIRRGIASHTLMDLTFDPALAAPDDEQSVESAGTLTTYRCEQDALPCPASAKTEGDFDRAKLEPIPELTHDALGLYELPDGRRLRNYLLGARFESTDNDGSVQRHASVYVSLLDEGDIEVRVIAPSILADEGHERFSAMFGVFSLSRQKLP
jgi:hypothetical protein